MARQLCSLGGDRSRVLAAAAFVAVTSLAADVVAQSSGTINTSGPGGTKDEYGGVVPGATKIVPPGAPWRSSRHAPVFWIGFQPRGGGASRVFVQLGRELEFDQRIDKNQLVVTLDQARFANSNAARPIITRFFEGALAEITPKRIRRRAGGRGTPGRRGGIELRILFKNPADVSQASATLSREKDGFVYLYLDFGPGTEVEQEEVTAEPVAGGEEDFE